VQGSPARVVISGTGLYKPEHVISNAELVASYNAYANLQNALNAERIAAGEVEPLPAVQRRVHREGLGHPAALRAATRTACSTRAACGRALRAAAGRPALA
jgi:hypothetical protein